jgi:hypothetical protein
MKRSGFHRSCLLAVVLLGFGCGAGSGVVRRYPAPAAPELMAALKARQNAVRSINAETRATSWLGGERVRGTVQMLADRSGQLRFEAEVALQGTVAALAVSNGQFTFIDYQKHVFRQGPACPANVAGLIRIPLEPTAVAAILLGDAPTQEATRAGGVDWDAGRAADVLVLDQPSGSRFWLSMRKPNPAVAAWDVVALEGAAPGATQRWRVSYEDLERLGGVSLPRLIRFAEPGKGFDDGVEIRIRDRQINGAFAENAFVLQKPSGYPIEFASCGTPPPP